MSRVFGVPTNAFELVEFAAARDACRRAAAPAPGAVNGIERRRPLERRLDVLAQHLVTVASGEGFEPAAMLAEVRRTRAYAQLTDEQWSWALDFVTRGGPTLGAYHRFARVVEREGRCAVAEPAIARRHRMAIGTIDSDASMTVRFAGGRRLGTIEERFIGRLRPGDRFVFAGRTVELVRVHEMTAHVRRATGRRGVVPRWVGSISPLSTKLAGAVRSRLDEARTGRFRGPEMRLVPPLLELQARWSRIPGSGELLIERLRLNGVHHAFVFSFGGRLVHEGLSALVAHRITRARPCSVAVTGNDYGFELTSRDDLALDEAAWRSVLSPERLVEDLLACLNDTELARRRFRGIARVAGLVFAGFPGEGRTARQLQASSDLFYDVFREYDPGHLLLEQARREVLDAELEVRRLRALLARLQGQALQVLSPRWLTPMSFPLWAESLRTQHVSSESWRARVERMAERLEQAAAKPTRRRPALAPG